VLFLDGDVFAKYVLPYLPRASPSERIGTVFDPLILVFSWAVNVGLRRTNPINTLLYYIKNFNNIREMKVLIEVKRPVWGRVKEFATVRKLTLNLAAEVLLVNALRKFGHWSKNEELEIEPI
jgi:hypothetical protein